MQDEPGKTLVLRTEGFKNFFLKHFRFLYLWTISLLFYNVSSTLSFKLKRNELCLSVFFLKCAKLVHSYV